MRRAAGDGGTTLLHGGGRHVLPSGVVYCLSVVLAVVRNAVGRRGERCSLPQTQMHPEVGRARVTLGEGGGRGWTGADGGTRRCRCNWDAASGADRVRMGCGCGCPGGPFTCSGRGTASVAAGRFRRVFGVWGWALQQVWPPGSLSLSLSLSQRTTARARALESTAGEGDGAGGWARC